MAADPHFANHIKHVWPSLDERFAVLEMVQDLRRSAGWPALYRLVEAEIATIDRELDGAQEPLTQAEYAMKHGRRDGLLGYIRAADAIVSKIERELEEQQARHEGDAEPSLTGG